MLLRIIGSIYLIAHSGLNVHLNMTKVYELLFGQVNHHLTEGVHPEIIAYSGGGGHWVRNLSIASQQRKGVCPEWLIPLNWNQIDTVSFNLDLCVKVKVTKKFRGRKNEIRHGY